MPEKQIIAGVFFNLQDLVQLLFKVALLVYIPMLSSGFYISSIIGIIRLVTFANL